MTKRALSFFLGILLAAAAGGCSDVQTAAGDDSRDLADSIGGIREVILSGSPYERGVQHGTILKNEIQKLVSAWKAELATQSKMEADDFIKQFLSQTDFVPAIEKWTPDLLEEVRGIAQGAGLSFETMYAFQCVDEIWLYLDGLAAEGCSAIGSPGRGGAPSLVAQNMDLEPFRQGSQVLFRIQYPDSTLEALVFTCAGLIVTTGMNNAPLGVAVNAMEQVDYRREGLPVAFVVRGLLAKSSLREAVEFLRNVPHASGQNYILGDAERVVDFEVSKDEVVRYFPAQEGAPILHTNHPLVLSDFNPRYARAVEGGQSIRDLGENTFVRLESLESRLAGRREGLEIEDVKSTLSAKDSAENPVCRAHDPEKSSFTFGTVIQVLDKEPKLHIAPGPPDRTPFQVFALAQRD